MSKGSALTAYLRSTRRQAPRSMTPLSHTLATTIFPHLPSSTAKEAQASWRLAEVIAAGITEELNRQARVNSACVKCA